MPRPKVNSAPSSVPPIFPPPNVNPSLIPPEELPSRWELAVGEDTLERVTKVGRERQEYLSRKHVSEGGSDGKSGGWEAVASLGKGALQLVEGAEADREAKRRARELAAEKERKRREKGLAPAAAAAAAADDEDEEEDDDEGALEEPESDSESEPEELENKTKEQELDDDANMLLDNDWATADWTVNEVESACSVLITSLETHPSPRYPTKKYTLALRMLQRLITRHPEARVYVCKVTESLLSKAFPSITLNGISPEAVNLGHMLGRVASNFSVQFSEQGPLSKACALLMLEENLAANVIQWRLLRLPKLMKNLKRDRQARDAAVASAAAEAAAALSNPQPTTPKSGALKVGKFGAPDSGPQRRAADASDPDDALSRRLMSLLNETEKRSRLWRRRNLGILAPKSSKHFILPETARVSVLLFVEEMCSPESAKALASGNRREVVKCKGMVPIALAIKGCRNWLKKKTSQPPPPPSSNPGADDNMFELPSHRVALRVLHHLAKELPLLLPLLLSRVTAPLESVLTTYGQPGTEDGEDVLLALDALDAICAAACKTANGSIEEIEYEQMNANRVNRQNRGETMKGGIITDNENDCPDDIEDESEKAYFRRATRTAVRKILVRPKLIQALISLLYGNDAATFLGAVMIMHKMACTQGYNRVLIEITAYAGRGMCAVVENIMSQDEGGISVACLAFLKQLATKQEGRDAMITSRAVEMLFPLVTGKHATPSDIFTLALTALVSLCQEGVGTQVPFDANASKTKDELFNDLLLMMTKPGEAPFISIRHLLDLQIMPFVVSWLSRPDHPEAYFQLSNHHKQMGAIILHRLSLHSEACLKFLSTDAVRKYFAYTIQLNFTLLIEQKFGQNAADRTLFFSSLQSALRGLAQIAKVSDDGPEKVMETVSNCNIFKEIEDLLGFPSVKLDDTYQLRLDCCDAACCLISEMAKVPEYEGAPENDKESKLTLKQDTEQCVSILKRLVSQMAKPLLSVVHGCPNRSAVGHACLALAKLGSTVETCGLLLEMGALKIAATLFPDKPGILEGAKGRTNKKAAIFDVDAKLNQDRDVLKLVSLNSNVFTLVGSLARTSEGKAAVQNLGILKRCIERLHLTSGKNSVDVLCRGEIAMVVARLANTHSNKNGNAGSANDFILNQNYNTLDMLIELVREGGANYRRARYWATLALSELCLDTLRVVPNVVQKGGIAAFGDIVRGFARGGDKDPRGVPMPLLRPALVALMRILTYPLAAFVPAFMETDLQKPLTVIASNVSLQMEFCSVKDRQTVGDVARDMLFALTEGKATVDRAGGVAPEETLQSVVAGSVFRGPGGEDDYNRTVSALEASDESTFKLEDTRFTATDGVSGLDGTYLSMGTSTVGSLAENFVEDGHTTRLLKLDVEDDGYREELMRRKEFYGMSAKREEALDADAELDTTSPSKGGGKVKSVAGSDGVRGKKKLGESPQKSIVKSKIEQVKDLRAQSNFSDDGAGDGDSSPTAESLSSPPNPPVMLPSHVVDVSAIPALASTRPSMPAPKPLHSPEKTLPSPLLRAAESKDGQKPAGGKQYVTFTRPKAGSAGLFTDPTFIDSNPVPESAIMKLGNSLGAPRLLSAASIITDNLDYQSIETYSHTVSIMGTSVKVAGRRVAGPGAILDDAGRPTSAVTFDNVHEAATKRELLKLKKAAGLVN